MPKLQLSVLIFARFFNFPGRFFAQCQPFRGLLIHQFAVILLQVVRQLPTLPQDPRRRSDSPPSRCPRPPDGSPEQPQEFVAVIVDHLLEGRAAVDDASIQNNKALVFDAEADLRRGIKRVDPGELGVGLWHATGTEGEAKQDHPDPEKVLFALDHHVETATHLPRRNPPQSEPVEQRVTSSQDGVADELAVDASAGQVGDEAAGAGRVLKASPDLADGGDVGGEEPEGTGGSLLQASLGHLLAGLLDSGHLGVEVGQDLPDLQG